MLNDAQVERYARHVLLPEVGGRGQARLLAARVAVLGDTAVARIVRDLVRRSGATVGDRTGRSDAIVVTDDRPSASCASRRRPTVLVRATGRRARLVLLDAAPCVACADPELTTAQPPGPEPGAALAAATGALAATLTICALLGRPGGSILHDVDLGGIDLSARPLTGPGCPSCRTAT
jgi:hypothetical protein